MSETIGNTTSRIDKDALKHKYAEERAKRLRADGNDQYIRIEDQLAHYLKDPYMPFTAREPVKDHVTFAFIGGGFSGLVTGARLVEAGISDVRIIEKGGDFGGTWYWNRYPGAQCDTASIVYMPLLEETGHMPSEKYAHAPEILEQCQRIGVQFNLYDNALFHTQATLVEWLDEKSCWLIKTDRGDEFTARYLGMGTGPLHVPKLPGIAGIEEFKGHSFHTSRWDYDYTGGDPLGASLDKLKDKRVAVIGTGATSVQCVPHLAPACEALYVFQRTPSSVDVRDNEPGAFLIDTDGQGVERITEKGVVIEGKEYEVDCIIYASGFEVGTPQEQRAGFDLTGRDGEKLSDHWGQGMRTLHGIHMHGFPNAFLVQATQGANLISNYPHNLTEAGRTIANTIAHAEGKGFHCIEVTEEAEKNWVELLMTGTGMMIGSQDCTPGYYNNEGVDPGPARSSFVGYPAGAVAFFAYIEEWRTNGKFEGLEFRQ